MEERRLLVVKLIMMVGIAASGKSTLAEKIAEKENAKIFSSDALRAELYGDENDQSHNGEVFNELHRRIKEHLRAGGNVIYDATNLNMKRRMTFLQELKKIPCIKKAVVVLCPYNDAIIRNASRKRQVPADVIKKHIKQFQIPMKFEGWDSIDFVNSASYGCGYKLTELMRECEIPHDNPHHSLNIVDHMRQCEEEAIKRREEADVIVVTAARYHDIGKSFCKEFKNNKGESCEVAHYYNHHNASAYLFLCSIVSFFYDRLEERTKSKGELSESLTKWSIENSFWEVISEMTFLINYHMDPFLKSEKTYKKFEELIGEERSKRLKILHECDLAAH